MHSCLSGLNMKFASCCRGIREDLQRRLPLYISDWTDINSSKIISTTFFIFFTSIAPAITFSLFITDSTKSQLGVIEILLSTALTGILFSVFAGQPLVIVGVTGPVAILTASIYTLSKAWGVHFLPFYAWAQLWAALLHIILASFNACDLVSYVTRFSCESFGVLIALIYIYTGLEGIAHFFADNYTFQVALLQFIIAIGTAFTSSYLSGAKHWHIGHEHLRTFLADYGATLSVVGWSFLPYICSSRLNDSNLAGSEDNHVPKLYIPLTFTTTSGRGWFVNFLDIPSYGIFLAIFPGVIITILFFFDHNVSSLISQTKDKKLKKGAAFHWDFFVLGVGLVLTGLLGLPPTNGLIPQAPLHVNSLTIKKRHPERKQDFYIDRVVEQRWTNLAQSILTFLAIIRPFSYVIREIPHATLYGLFLYLGWSSFEDNQFACRVNYLMKDDQSIDMCNNMEGDETHWFRRDKLSWQVIRKYTLLQALCCGVIFGITFTPAEVIFPVLIALLVIVRLLVFPINFSDGELALLDGDIFNHNKKEEQQADSDFIYEEPSVRMEHIGYDSVDMELATK